MQQDKRIMDYVAKHFKQQARNINDVNRFILFIVDNFIAKNNRDGKLELLNETLDILGCKEKNDMIKIWKFLREDKPCISYQ